jgi:glucosamine-6-phosphate deaminase
VVPGAESHRLWYKTLREIQVETIGGHAVIVRVFGDKVLLGQGAAEQAAHAIRSAIRERGRARIIVATGASQLDFLAALVQAKEIDWKKVEMFHLDEYVGLPMEHPASFRKYLTERFIHKTGITKYHFLDGNADPAQTVRSVGDALKAAPIDVAFVGIGENGHLAFNDPPANFTTEEPYLIVELDEPCRKQQVGEGWFKDISEVPPKAISMSVQQILKATEIICVVPDARKAAAVKLCLEGEISPIAPASILRTHAATTIFLDMDSARSLSPTTITAMAANT